MKHPILKRVFCLSTAAAAALSWSAGGGVLQGLAAQIPSADRAASYVQQTECSEPVTVIVRVSGGAIMEQPDALGQGADYLDTDAAAQIAKQNKAIQRSVQERIRQIYPALKIGFSYTTLYNGFSCKLPENLIEQVRALPDVDSVTVSEEIVLPQMNRAAALSGYPAFADQTGCSGEGQVIAVIDSELDITHPMFDALADGIETAVSREEVEDIIGSGALNIDADADYAYISNKLPFVMDYVDDDPYGGVPDRDSYHGTHVSGIAAGNTFTGDDGTVYSGIAKDAQLMFFGVGTGSRGISPEAGLAAIEDAVKLHADVINMSWGGVSEKWGENPISDAIFAADRAGVTVCNSAGNGDNGTYSWNEPPVPDNPDSNMMNYTPELGSPVLMVASADNTGETEYGTVVCGGRKILCMPMLDSMGAITYLADSLTPGAYEFVDCGSGSRADFLKAGDLEGRIALVQRGSELFSVMSEAAEKRGAAAVLVSDKEESDGMQYIPNDFGAAMNLISYEDGQAMRTAEDRTVIITGEKVKRVQTDQTVSTFTSWGVKQSLDLRPDIMGIGGNVRSAAYDGGERTMSGTSMSSPYIAGCTAVLREYLKKQGTELTGSDFNAYVRRLLMNTAYPYQEDDLFVTPRRQGAGMVALDRALDAKVLMTGEAGDAKVNLFDQLGDDFSFPVMFTNSSDEAVTFPQAEIRLTTDGVFFDAGLGHEILRGQQELRCTSDFSAPVTVAAGETKTATVSVSLDTEQCRKLEQTFRNGFFVEGYLLLSGAQNSADISIPLLGYHGDWAQIPVVTPGTGYPTIRLGIQQEAKPESIVHLGALCQEILSRVPDSELTPDRSVSELLEQYATAAEKKLLSSAKDECWISPNNDSIADALFSYGGNQDSVRLSCHYHTELIDPDGNVLYSEPVSMIGEDFDFSALKEEDYTFVYKIMIDYQGSAERPQVIRSTVHIDRTKPQVTHRITEENGKKYLVIKSSDNRQLQGMIVTGTGSGRASADPDIMSAVNSYLFGDKGYADSCDMDLEAGGFVTEALPYAIRKFFSISAYEEGQRFNYVDVLEPEPDASGVWEVKYDITDLTDYSFTVLDEAYNFAEIYDAGTAAEDMAARKGVWMDPNAGYYVFSGDAVTHTSFLDGSVTAYSYQAKGGTLTLTSGKQKKDLTIRRYADNRCKYDDPDTDHAGMLLTGESMTQYAGRINQPFHPVNQLIEQLKQDFRDRFHVDAAEKWVTLRHADELIFTLYNEDDPDHWFEDYITLSIFTGRGNESIYEYTRENGEIVGEQFVRHLDLYPDHLTEIPAGLYKSTHDNAALYFHDDGKTGTIMYIGFNFFGGIGVNADTPFTYTIGENGYFTMHYSDKTILGSLTKDAGTDELLLTYDADHAHYHQGDSFDNLIPVITDPEQLAKLRPTAEITGLAAAYISASVRAEVPPRDRIDLYENTGMLCYNYAYTGDFTHTFSLMIDPDTLDVTDGDGNRGNLLDPPVIPKNAAYTMPELAKLGEKAFRERTGIQAYESAAFMTSSGQAMVILSGTYNEYLEMYYADPVTGSLRTVKKNRGDVNCDGSTDVSDAVLLARFLVEDRSAKITADGLDNADVNLNMQADADDMTMLLNRIARIIVF
ncbi:MAG: S8 family serine peptidase [Oscillospiraceae bacterium]|nr:S8 family serine peptidase [Oscillospiraceae bacterium]